LPKRSCGETSTKTTHLKIGKNNMTRKSITYYVLAALCLWIGGYTYANAWNIAGSLFRESAIVGIIPVVLTAWILLGTGLVLLVLAIIQSFLRKRNATPLTALPQTTNYLHKRVSPLFLVGAGLLVALLSYLRVFGELFDFPWFFNLGYAFGGIVVLIGLVELAFHFRRDN